MIFVLGKNEPALFLMLSEADVVAMRQGSTRWVDNHQLGAATFTRAIISLHKSDQAAMELLRRADPEGAAGQFQVPEPAAGETRCQGPCNGIMPFADLFEGQCIVCWAGEAKKARPS